MVAKELAGNLTTVKLSLIVTLEDVGDSIKQIEENLLGVAQLAMGEGMVTAGTGATVDAHKVIVDVLPPIEESFEVHLPGWESE